MTRRNLTVRTIALISAGSAAVHELRYLIGYGSGAQHALAAHPHGYLSVALPGILTALVVGMVALPMRAVGSRQRPHSAAPARSLVGAWIASALALASIFAIQETLEGAGALAHGGWIGLVLAIPVGLVVALVMRGADAAEALRAGRAPLVGFAVARAVIPSPQLLPHPQLATAPLGARGPPRSLGL